MPKVIKIIRRSSGLIENICEHGVGHPNKELTPPEFYYGVHGCDDCCAHPDFRPTKEQVAAFKKENK